MYKFFITMSRTLYEFFRDFDTENITGNIRKDAPIIKEYEKYLTAIIWSDDYNSVSDYDICTEIGKVFCWSNTVTELASFFSVMRKYEKYDDKGYIIFNPQNYRWYCKIWDIAYIK